MPILWPDDHEPATPLQNRAGFVLLFLWIWFLLFGFLTAC